MKNRKLGVLESVELREVWKDETKDFTPWVADNLALLNTILSMQLEWVESEKKVGSFSADLFCFDHYSGTNVVIENQLEKTDHDHLGKVITYAAGLDVSTIIWIAREFRDEHRAALDWLNQTTGDDVSYFGLDVELWCIGTSLKAPKFNIVVQPNDWMRSISKSERRSPLTEIEHLHRDFWNALRGQWHSNTALELGHTQHGDWLMFRLEPEWRISFRACLDVRNKKFWVELGFFDLGRKDGTSAERSRLWFDTCKTEKAEIEEEFGYPLTWEFLNVECYLKYIRNDVDLRKRESWPEYIDWMQTHLEKLDVFFRPRIQAFMAQHGE